MKAMRLVVFAVLSLGFALSANARPSTWEMTCADAAQLVIDQPGVVMNYRYSEKAGNLYNKYVPETWYCANRKGLPPYVRAVVKTLDSDACNIGFSCPAGYRDIR